MFGIAQEQFHSSVHRIDHSTLFVSPCCCLVLLRREAPDTIEEVKLLTPQECRALRLFISMKCLTVSASALGLAVRTNDVATQTMSRIAHSGQMIVSALRIKMEDWRHERLQTIWGASAYILAVE